MEEEEKEDYNEDEGEALKKETKKRKAMTKRRVSMCVGCENEEVIRGRWIAKRVCVCV